MFRKRSDMRQIQRRPVRDEGEIVLIERLAASPGR